MNSRRDMLRNGWSRRATELHMNALTRYTRVPVYKRIIARRFEQVNVMKERYGYG